jgi:hypothetical protein
VIVPASVTSIIDELMRIEFRYSLDDVREALIPEARITNPRRFRRRFILGVILWFVIVVLIALSMWLQSVIPRSTVAPAQPPPRDLVAELLPPVLAGAFLCLTFFLAIWTAWRKAHRTVATGPAAASPMVASRVVGAVMGLMMFVGVGALFNPDYVLIWHPTRTQTILASAAPWFVCVFMLLLLGRLQRRWTPRQRWLSNPAWRRPHVIELDATGLQLSDPLMRLQMDWSCISRARETPALLVLVNEDGKSYILPKRAFRDSSEIAQARAILQNAVKHTSFLVDPVGFAVLPRPVLPVYPLPEMAAGAVPPPLPSADQLRSSD